MDGRRVLGRVAREEFTGRAGALKEIVRLGSREAETRGLLVLAAPAVGASELLRQTYDDLFHLRGETIPIYFALARSDKTTVGSARRFLHTFLQQLIAFRRRDPALSDASLPTAELLDLAVPSDSEWVENLFEASERERLRGDERAFIRLCLSAPQRAAARGLDVLVMLDSVHLAENLDGEVALGTEIAQVFLRSDMPFVLEGLRRRLLDVVHCAGDGLDGIRTLRLGPLSDEDSRALVEHAARRQRIAVNEQTRDLIVQQLGGRPFFINALLQAAREKNVELTSFLNCQRLYVDELMGGRINRHYASLLEEVAPGLAPRRALIRALYESAASDSGKSQIETWRKRLGLDADQLQSVLRELHVNELASVSASFVEVGNSASLWGDFLHARYRLEVSAEPRALVVADLLLETLKRAPQTMARHYRRAAAVGLRDMLARFNCQRVPASLLHYERFSRAYKGVDGEAVAAGLDA
ncbi:MAG TPA: hypothetical protein VD966_09530, partial [Pyrinomonadaceae bacterium]|nr:hypothetical protein [Pyrinomonadaceae bacterium]